MRKVIFMLNKPLSTPSGRNEKIKTRLDFLDKRNIENETYLIKYSGYGWLFEIFIRALINSIKFKSKFNEDRIVIITMNSPAYSHMFGLINKILNGNIKWVAEFRDGMLEEPHFSQKPLRGKISSFLMEKISIKKADKILIDAGSVCTLNHFKKNYPNKLEKVTKLPYMGYKKEDFEGIDPKKYDRYTITYAGRLYKNWIDPSNFIKAFSKFVEKNELIDEDIKVNFFVKNWDENYSKLINELNLIDYFNVEEFIEREELISVLKGSDLLLYLHGSNKTKNNMIHSKLWEYIGSGSPVLVLGNRNHEIYNLIRENKLGLFAEEYDEMDILKKLEIAYEKNINIKNSGRFTRKKHDEKFYEEIIELLLN